MTRSGTGCEGVIGVGWGGVDHNSWGVGFLWVTVVWWMLGGSDGVGTERKQA